ncbi:MAG: carbon-nitrogen hydrolase family protein [Tissierellia bacterium]|nr:carbon-nitrogen hydrolase family protein [Tissierellia bacterium]
MKDFKVGIVQMSSKGDKNDNIAKMEEMVRHCSEAGAQIVVLPEMWNCPYQNSYFTTFAEEEYEDSYLAMKETARNNKIYLVGGSIPVKGGKKVYNRSYVFQPDGKEIYRYSKVNLFDIENFQESDTIAGGKSIGVFETEFGIFGLAICYDLRFPEIFKTMVDFGAEGFFVPSTFTLKTGRAHWDLLCRARAVDTESYLITSSIARDDKLSKNAYGHSNIISPMGDILVDLGVEEQFMTFDIKGDFVDEMRRKFPLEETRRKRSFP